ncbi:Sec-independent protein translocase protein TatB [Sphingorhabdus sp. Alg239-R122]|uniref:Sec-independent protein translocase protein TatB n=1 Tax=Sphingorhabdus sp. Alg239-R122 TaxID=2305989 RepID=UPI0013DD3DE2|nr:Sec-independent protein translocase protein TatB [Sphingorhabdus sp. Alg239-R122]
MFDIGAPEILLIAIVAIIVIGPKDLPVALRFAGKWVSKARGMMRELRSGFDSMVREAEMEEMEKKWAENNERIMRESADQEMLPLPPEEKVEPDSGKTTIDVSDNDVGTSGNIADAGDKPT